MTAEKYREDTPERSSYWNQVGGMLLEEAVLYLLEASGYTTISEAAGDSTLHDGKNGMEVQGRGGKHQIDAIADFAIEQPFSYPHRLLVEAKFQMRPVGIEVIRNAVGVLEDINTYWDKAKGKIVKRRSYNYAIFSASGYTKNAAVYALAHGIYLIPLRHSKFIQPILQSISDILPPARIKLCEEKYLMKDRPMLRFMPIPNLRKLIRTAIRYPDHNVPSEAIKQPGAKLLDVFCYKCRQLDGAILGMLDKHFPVFFIPSPSVNLNNIQNCETQVYWDDVGWYLQLSEDQFFSFDLPTEIFSKYAEKDGLSELRALELKTEYFSTIQTIIKRGQDVRVVTFSLDLKWLQTFRESIEQIQRGEWE